MAYPEQPFDEREKRYFLAEILKASSIDPTELLNLIREREIAPSWMEMALPNGRTAADCSRAFQALLGSSVGPPASFQPHYFEQQQPAHKSKKKQPQSSGAPGSMTDRTSHPQQSNFPPVNATSDPITFQVAPTAPVTNTEQRPGKKRGRPSKAVYEQRVREAAERGEVYPPPRKRKTPRASLEGVPGEGMLTPTKAEAEAGAAGESSTGKRKTRPKASAKVAPLEPTLALEGDLALEATASAADRMQSDAEKEPVRSTIPETQSTDFPAQDSLLSGLREYAAQTGADTAQSSSTLKGDYSAPRIEWGTPGVVPATPNPVTTAAAQANSATTKPAPTDPARKE